MESSVQELIAATQNAEKDLRLIIAEMRGDGNGIAPSILIDGWANELERIYIALGSVNAFPLRNCDVGTADEQADRFGKLCVKYYNEEEHCNRKCPLASLDFIHGFPRCQAYWTQMPYESEAAHG